MAETEGKPARIVRLIRLSLQGRGRGPLRRQWEGERGAGVEYAPTLPLLYGERGT